MKWVTADTLLVTVVSLVDNGGHHNPLRGLKSHPVSETQPESSSPVVEIVVALCHLCWQMGGKEQRESCPLVLSLQSCLGGPHQV